MTTRRTLPVLDRRHAPPTPSGAQRGSALAGLRLLLINPPQTYPKGLEREYQSYWPVGLAMIAAVTEQAGADVKCIDCLAYDKRSQRPRDGAIRFGLGDPQLSAEIAAYAPHIVGITNPFTHFVEDAIWVAQRVKKIDPTIPVVMGGIEASLPDRSAALLRGCPAIDVLVKGEGEATIVDLLQRYDHPTRTFDGLESVSGILFRYDGSVVTTNDRGFLADLDSLPLPAYHLFDIDRMYANRYYALNRGRKPGIRCLPIHTSRGCPYSCNFCSVHSQVGKAHRRHSVGYVRRHMELVMQRYGVGHFHFEDDNLTLHHDHSLKLFSAIRELGVTWDTPNGTRADAISPALARAMAAAGASTVTIAVESGNQRVLDNIVHKHLSLKDVVEAVRNLHTAGVPTLVFYIVGFPGETEQDIRDTLRFGCELAIDYGTVNLLFVATPLPGTPLHAECEDNEYLCRELDNASLLSAIRLNQSALIKTPEFSKADLYAWSRQELEREAIHTLGRNIPMFFATTEDGLRNAKQVLGYDFGSTLPTSYWASPPALAG